MLPRQALKKKSSKIIPPFESENPWMNQDEETDPQSNTVGPQVVKPKKKRKTYKKSPN